MLDVTPYVTTSVIDFYLIIFHSHFVTESNPRDSLCEILPQSYIRQTTPYVRLVEDTPSLPFVTRHLPQLDNHVSEVSSRPRTYRFTLMKVQLPPETWDGRSV